MSSHSVMSVPEKGMDLGMGMANWLGLISIYACRDTSWFVGTMGREGRKAAIR